MFFQLAATAAVVKTTVPASMPSASMPSAAAFASTRASAATVVAMCSEDDNGADGDSGGRRPTALSRVEDFVDLSTSMILNVFGTAVGLGLLLNLCGYGYD